MIDQNVILQIAARAGCCPQTVAKALRGQPIRGQVGARVRAILAEAGLISPLNSEHAQKYFSGPLAQAEGWNGALGISTIGYGGGPR